MKSILFYKILRQLKFFKSNKFRLEPLKVEPEEKKTVFGKISLMKVRETEALLKSRSRFLEEWKTEENADKSVLFVGYPRYRTGNK